MNSYFKLIIELNENPSFTETADVTKEGQKVPELCSFDYMKDITLEMAFPYHYLELIKKSLQDTGFIIVSEFVKCNPEEAEMTEGQNRNKEFLQLYLDGLLEKGLWFTEKTEREEIKRQFEMARSITDTYDVIITAKYDLTGPVTRMIGGKIDLQKMWKKQGIYNNGNVFILDSRHKYV